MPYYISAHAQYRYFFNFISFPSKIVQTPLPTLLIMYKHKNISWKPYFWNNSKIITIFVIPHVRLHADVLSFFELNFS